MEILTAFILIFLATILIIVLFNSISGPFLKKEIALNSSPEVSVLIPARNEEKNIANCLKHLLDQDYDNLEILVLDDESDDNTTGIVRSLQKINTHIKLVHGKPLPVDWAGKNWACHQLSKKATGEIFIFTDADTTHKKTAVTQTVAWMQKLDAGFISAFPQQICNSFIEKLTIPVIDFFVYGMLPLWLTYYFRSSAFAASNGQWMAFKRETYLQIGGHKSVKSKIVEDVELNRLVKRSGIKTLTTAGTNIVFCRMYHSFFEVWYGFSKNFYGLTGHSAFLFILIEALLSVCCVLPYILWILNPVSVWLFTAVILNLMIRAILSIRFKHPFLISVILHPFSILFAMGIGINSFFQYHWGSIKWKNRKIQFKTTGISVNNS